MHQNCPLGADSGGVKVNKPCSAPKEPIWPWPFSWPDLTRTRVSAKRSLVSADMVRCPSQILTRRSVWTERRTRLSRKSLQVQNLRSNKNTSDINDSLSKLLLLWHRTWKWLPSAHIRMAVQQLRMVRLYNTLSIGLLWQNRLLWECSGRTISAFKSRYQSLWSGLKKIKCLKLSILN